MDILEIGHFIPLNLAARNAAKTALRHSVATQCGYLHFEKVHLGLDDLGGLVILHHGTYKLAQPFRGAAGFLGHGRVEHRTVRPRTPALGWVWVVPDGEVRFVRICALSRAWPESNGTPADKMKGGQRHVP